MDAHLLNTHLELHRDDLLREAEQARIGAQLREPHAWRHRLGEAFIRLGRRMAAEPEPKQEPTAFTRTADKPAASSRIQREPHLRVVRAADNPNPRPA